MSKKHNFKTKAKKDILGQGTQTRMRPAKALFAARNTLSEILKIWDKNKLFYSFYSIFLLVTQRNYYFSHLRSL